MQIMNQTDIESNIAHWALRKFWQELSLESKELIVAEYIRVSSNTKNSENIIICQDDQSNRKLIIEEGIGLHKFSTLNLSHLAEGRILLPQAFIDGKLCHPPMGGNIAPFCTHFVKTSFPFLLEDMKKFYDPINSLRQHVGNNLYFFDRDCRQFLDIETFMNPAYGGYVTGIPILFVYKRKNKDIDIMNDVELTIHDEFLKNSSLVYRYDYFNPEFTYYMQRTMAILGGVHISQCDGIIIPEERINCLNKVGIFPFSSTKDFITYLKEMFPNLYISNERGQLLYVPSNAKILRKQKTDNPFILN